MKKLNIEPPEGYEIDNEKSDLSEGTVRFKQIKKGLTYEEVCTELGFLNRHFYCKISGDIGEHVGKVFEAFLTYRGNESPSKEQLAALLALNKLKNVANYLNGDWKPDWETNTEKWEIGEREFNKEIMINSYTYYNSGRPTFKNKELAEQAIKILGEDTIKLALSFGSI